MMTTELQRAARTVPWDLRASAERLYYAAACCTCSYAQSRMQGAAAPGHLRVSPVLAALVPALGLME
jgi:hypothetical protein